MRKPEPKSPWLLYTGTLAVGVAVIAVSLVAIGHASVGLMQRTERDRTFLDQQIESAREIRAALAKPIAMPAPLPPVTARPLRDVTAASAEPPRLPARTPKYARQGMDAMAMAPGARNSAYYYVYPGPDRFTPQ